MCNFIKTSKKGVSVQVSVCFFEDGGSWIAYCPSLDLSGYGADPAAAAKDFEFVIGEYLSDQLAAGTLFDDLAAHGWKRPSRNRAIEPPFLDTIAANSQLKRVASRDFSKRNIAFSQPCMA